MLTYISIYLYAYIFSYIKPFFYVILIAIAIIGGYNSNIQDFHTYFIIFQQVPPIDTLVNNLSILHKIYGEDGFLLLISLFKLFSNDYYIFRIFILILSLFSIGYVIKNSDTGSYLPIALIIYLFNYFYLDNIALRTAIATAFLLLSFFYFERKNSMWILFVLLALSMHLGTLIGIFVFLF